MAADGDQHWSRQFAKPKSSTAMLPSSGLTDAGGKARIKKALWHEGKLWMAGVWESGVDARDLRKRKPNQYWHLWTWSPEHGYQVHAHFSGAQGGRGPDGVINDFLFLPDGRLVVAGEFTRLGNPGGNRYHKVNALAIYDEKIAGPNKWRPLGSVQYNGTVSNGGSIKTIAYDPQANDLYIGGAFPGITFKKPEKSNAIHRYDFDTGQYLPIMPGFGGSKPDVYRIRVDTSTKPSTVYIGGKFHYTDGNGLNPEIAASTAKYSTSFAAWQAVKGWTTFPKNHPTDGSEGKESGILKRAGDYMAFDAAIVRDFLIDNGDIWICGSFSQGEGKAPLRGIAKWDAAKEEWVDPTGKGGVGRDCLSVAKAANGKIYFAGAFGGRKGAKDFYKGFMNGDPAHGAISYDPATKTWAQLGSGLSTRAMPEVRLTTAGNDVYFVGDFNFIDPKNFGRKAAKNSASNYIARWNETIDFLKKKPKVAGANAPYPAPPIAVAATPGNEHWSRAFVKPKRGDKRKVTGMNDGVGTPDISGMAWIGNTLYFGGSWEAERGKRWYAWSFNVKTGYKKIAWAKGPGIQSPPEGVKAHGGKLYAYGAISSHSGVGIYDPKSGKWAPLKGTFRGKPVIGNGALNGTGVVNDMAWDDRTGDTYIVGNWSPTLGNPDYKFPKDVAAVIRIDKSGAYHVMGHDLKPEDPLKPVKGIFSIVLDTKQTPTGIYIAGTFNYYGPVPTTNKRMLYNVARWDYTAKDWRPVGKGNRVHLRQIDAGSYPDGLHGLPARPSETGYTNYSGFIASGFPRVRALALDSAGNLYAGGTLGIVGRGSDMEKRRGAETFAIAKYDRASDRWIGPTKAGGLSRDISQMTFLNDKELLLSGSFVYDEQFNRLHNVAILDITTGALKPLGGGLLRRGRDHTIGSQVVHAVKGDQLWFAGLFDHAGANANAVNEAPIEANYVAVYHRTRNLDPNRGLTIQPVAAVKGPTGKSSVSAKVQLTATLTGGKGKITWYQRRSNGAYARKGSGPTYKANLRIKPGEKEAFYYVTVTRANGVEGGKMPVRIPVK